ncbi:MAG TPA: acetylglutamate kinase [Candidatus Hydrogenedentes bacterium]|nr:acetylglutamate kinase [Candidatus Hydrogenedentota bacterium]HRK35343.1 acetylglutamate kinase [Candidatus Hydrogenedentota bacterium]
MIDQYEQFIQKAATLVEALPYIREFEGKTVVVKYGGAAMENTRLRESTTEDITLMKYVGMNPVIVHGGGPEINRTLQRLGVESKFHNGLRITDEETVRVVEMVLAGSLNKEIVSLISRAGGNPVGLCGKDGNLLHARKLVGDDGTDLGYVGEITSVHFKIISVLCDAGLIPVIAPIATDPQGNTWNVNADSAAGEIAAAIQAEKLVFLTDTPGILRDPKDPASLIHQLDYREIENLIEQGVIAGGMIPKVEACLKALDYGVSKTHIIDGRVPHSLLLEIFTDQGMGTLVTH